MKRHRDSNKGASANAGAFPLGGANKMSANLMPSPQPSSSNDDPFASMKAAIDRESLDMLAPVGFLTMYSRNPLSRMAWKSKGVNVNYELAKGNLVPVGAS